MEIYFFKNLETPKEELTSLKLHWIQSWHCTIWLLSVSQLWLLLCRLPSSPPEGGPSSSSRLTLLGHQVLLQRVCFPGSWNWSLRGPRLEVFRSSLVYIVSRPPLEVTLGTGNVRQGDCVNSHSQAPSLDLAVSLAAPQTCELNGLGGSPSKNMSTGKNPKREQK